MAGATSYPAVRGSEQREEAEPRERRHPRGQARRNLSSRASAQGQRPGLRGARAAGAGVRPAGAVSPATHARPGFPRQLAKVLASRCESPQARVWGPAQALAVPMGSPCTGSLLPAQPPLLAHVSPKPASQGA